jgi:uncharacterized surface anchored protein
VIPDASVTLKNTATGIARDLKTNSAGEYVAAAVPPGQYNLIVTVAGISATLRPVPLLHRKS